MILIYNASVAQAAAVKSTRLNYMMLRCFMKFFKTCLIIVAAMAISLTFRATAGCETPPVKNDNRMYYMLLGEPFAQDEVRWLEQAKKLKVKIVCGYSRSLDSAKPDEENLTFQENFDENGERLITVLKSGGQSSRQRYVNGRKDIKEFKYDNKNIVIEELLYTLDRKLKYKTTFKSDEKGNTVECNLFDPAGAFVQKISYKFDGRGNAVLEERFDPSGALVQKYEMKYDANDYIVEKIFYRRSDSCKKISSIFNYKWNASGRIVEILNLKPSDRSIIGRFEFKYDEKGILQEYTESGKDGKPYNVTRYKYEY